jgi:hypothetical protein
MAATAATRIDGLVQGTRAGRAGRINIALVQSGCSSLLLNVAVIAETTGAPEVGMVICPS